MSLPAPTRKSLQRDPLQRIPSIGPSLAADLRLLGIAEIADLRERNPLQMFEQLCERTGAQQDRCVLYTFRCAVHYANTLQDTGELACWWNWKNRVHPNEQ
jgi:hypothetical protein